MKDKTVYLEVVLESLGLIKKYTKGHDLHGFLEDRKTQDAVIRNIEVIGKALKDYGIELLVVKNPDIPWQKIASMRNILAHEYLGVDLSLIWGTLNKDLDVLKGVLDQIVEKSDKEN